ncbi:MAG: T9SS type A sorting domain-containing protein [Ignavibacteria bacterium]|nr:T9SS type A sorting domain-containing protein [Ignavibacteria bacterium]MCU7515415.1 T9SS type A sorting domain-containing protein [Ignavibacteria bacterium]
MTSNGKAIFAGVGQCGTYRSTDNGKHWTKLNFGTEATTFAFQFVVSGDAVFAVGDDGLTYKSTDNGDSWKVSSTGLASLVVDGSNIYAWGWQGNYFYFSSDNGDTWNQTDIKFQRLACENIAAKNDTIIVRTLNVDTNEKGLLRSVDKGHTWSAIPYGFNGQSISCFKYGGNTLFAAATNGWFFKSNDNGDTWIPINNKLFSFYQCAGTYVNDMIIDADTIYASTDVQGVFKSTNNGEDWIPVDNGLSNTWLRCLCKSGNDLFAGSGNGVYLTSDGGNNWVSAKYNLGGARITSFYVCGNEIYAGTEGSGIYISTNQGQSWNETGLAKPCISGIVGDDVNIYAGTLNDGVFISNNKGQSWNYIGLAGALSPTALVLENNAIVSGSDFGAAFSADTGKTWTRKNNGLPITGEMNTGIRALAIKDSFIFAGLGGRGIYRYSDDREYWTEENTGLTNKTVNKIISNDGYLFAGTEDGVFISTDNGENWSFSGLKDFHIVSLARSAGKTFAAGINFSNGIKGTISLSCDNGKSWIEQAAGLEDSNVQQLAVCGSRLLAGTNSAIWAIPFDALLTGVENQENDSQIPSSYDIANYPNPFNPVTKIRISLPEESSVSLTIYNLLGREVKTILKNEKLKRGVYEYNWEGIGLPSGVYICRMQANNANMLKKMILLK